MRSRVTVLIFAPLLAVGVAGCEVQQEEPATTPDVEVEPGQLPEYDVETGDVEVQRDTERVIVPELEVEEPNREAQSRP